MAPVWSADPDEVLGFRFNQRRLGASTARAGSGGQPINRAAGPVFRRGMGRRPCEGAGKHALGGCAFDLAIVSGVSALRVGAAVGFGRPHATATLGSSSIP